jgi:hypothetical protein
VPWGSRHCSHGENKGHRTTGGRGKRQLSTSINPKETEQRCGPGFLGPIWKDLLVRKDWKRGVTQDMDEAKAHSICELWDTVPLLPFQNLLPSPSPSPPQPPPHPKNVERFSFKDRHQCLPTQFQAGQVQGINREDPDPLHPMTRRACSSNGGQQELAAAVGLEDPTAPSVWLLGPAWLFSWDLLCLVVTLVSPL